MRLPLKHNRITKAIVLPDIHVPKHDARALSIVEQVMGSQEFDYAIYLGDVIDLESISKYSKNDLRKLETRGVLREFEALEKVFDRHVKLLGDKCRIIWIQGNHEYRINRVIHVMPPLEGVLDIGRNISFVRDGRIEFVKFYETGEGVFLGDCLFIHGVYYSEYHAKRHAFTYHCNVVYGHTHDTDHYTRPTKFGKSITAQSLGCLCKLDLHYTALYGVDWQHAFAIYNFDVNGTSYPYIYRIRQGRLILPDGRVLRHGGLAGKAMERR